MTEHVFSSQIVLETEQDTHKKKKKKGMRTSFRKIVVGRNAIPDNKASVLWFKNGYWLAP